MIIELTKKEQEMLKNAGVDFSSGKNYSEDEALDLMEEIYEVEAIYANYPKTDKKAALLAVEYAKLGDKVYKMIPEY